MNPPIHSNPDIEIWFATGSQHLYGEATLREVAANSKKIVEGLAGAMPLRVVFKDVLTGPDAIRELALEANRAPNCAGLVFWMHTFSPAKMWIGGLSVLAKPFLHLHTQFNRDLPWGEIDMDFMNTNQAAHGDREFGFIGARMRIERKVVVGHWSDERVRGEIATWMRAARAWSDWQGAKFVRIGDNMRQVAVTEGNKVSAEIQFGFSVNTHGVGDVVAHVDAVSDGEVDILMREYADTYTLGADLRRGGDRHGLVRDAGRIELGLRAFLEAGGFKGFTDTFEDLHGLKQLPGIATQRLMADGYGFGGEGDWKTAALVRAMKVMAADLPGGVSFMEDYTYHLERRVGVGARVAHAGDLPVHRGGQTVARSASARDRREGGSGAARVRFARRDGSQRVADRPRQSFSSRREYGRSGRAAGAAAAPAGRAGRLEAVARLRDRVRGVDHCGRRAPHGIQ